MHAVTKSELAERLYERFPALTRQEASRALDAALETMTSALSQGVRVELKSFGTFNVKMRNARRARNPKTGEPVFVEAKFVPYFRASRRLADLLRDKGN